MKQAKYLQIDKTEKVYSSPRQEGTYLYFTGTGDNTASGAIGEGSSLFLTNTEAEKTVARSVQFIEEVYLKDGYIFWQNAVVGDRASLLVYLPANTPTPSEEDTGNAVLVDGVPTYITASETPDETWVGTHLYFPVDVDLIRFVNKFHLMGTNVHGLCIESSDAAHIPKELMFRLELYSPTNNPDISVSVMMEMYRENTI